ncbi:efflux RND transporter permease subunit [Aerosakkonema funiforme]|uniref:efflux RND transporter permease subunit n=1 Tax=Aerosakkonema funiforme TaxID=1246630 RepID=UPI0035B7F114
MFTHFFIKRPVFASVCSLLIILVGVVGYTRLPVQEYPSIDPPVVSVSTVYPGANPQVVETEITEILEAELNGVEGIKTLTSESRESVSTVTLQFELSRNLESAAQDVRDRVSRVTGRLPDDAEAPVVSKQSGDSSPIVWFALYGEKFSTLELSDYADKLIVDALETVPGVSSVIIGGERRYAMRIWLDPQKMAARNLTVLDVEQALRQENVEIPSGLVEGETSEYSVRTLGRLQTPPEYEALVIKRNQDGTQVTLKDIGRAEIGAENERSFVRFKQQPAVGLGVVKLSNANTLDVAEGAKEKMEELSHNFPEGMSYQIAFDSSAFVELAIEEVWVSLYLSIALVVLVIFIFLRDWRATLIPTVTIPISLIGAFGLMFFMGFSVNTLTLFALTLSTGLVVDDTIVVLENIVRYIEEKRMAPFPATFEATTEVVFAVIATTVVLIAVFVPVAFAAGTTGRLFNEFALTIAGAVVFSSIAALTLAPAMSARLLKPSHRENPTPYPSPSHGEGRRGEGQRRFGLRSVFAPVYWLLNFFEWGINRTRDIYAASLRLLMKLKLAIVVLFLISLAVTAWLFQLIPVGFLPNEDRGAILTVVRGPQGVTLNYTDKVMQQVENVLSQVPTIESYFAIGAFGGGSGVGQVNQGFVFSRLKPWQERPQPSQSQQATIGQLFGRYMQITDALVIPINPPALPGAGFSQPVQFVLQGNNLETLAQEADKLAQKARQLPQLVNVDTDLRLNKPELILTINREQAANLGVSVRDISRTLQILLGGQEITSFNRENRRYEVVVQADDRFRASPENIREFYVRSQQGQMIPLTNLVKVTPSTTPPQINHFNRSRAATISGSPAPGQSLGQALDALQNLAQQQLPTDIRTTLSGESLEFKEAGQSTIYIFGLALAFIFLVLAAQFESYIDPLVILLAVPLSLLGAFAALLLRGLDLNVYSQIGLIMLIGLVTKNSILIVEFANQLRQEQDLPIAKAAIEAGLVRFRPILMTAFSTIFGLIPLAIATGAGAASRVSLGMTVLGGMLISTFLSLYIVPVFYVIATSAQARLMKGRRG